MVTSSKTSKNRYLKSFIINDQPSTPNQPFGNVLSEKPIGCLRIFSTNVNGIYKNNCWDKWKEACRMSKIFATDVLNLTETNIKWNIKLQHSA
jgi:hypothetical protein